MRAHPRIRGSSPCLLWPTFASIVTRAVRISRGYRPYALSMRIFRSRYRRSMQDDPVVSPLISGGAVPERTYLSDSLSSFSPIQTQTSPYCPCTPARSLSHDLCFPSTSVEAGVGPRNIGVRVALRVPVKSSFTLS
ncbi:hypothetical protein BD309DRAFT_52815 [Dichomitus squalens]|uniref:Uncharacterized protein n=1 Tax=Dichomitus squalens TaxID=114155 RepID=A0A4Q9P915_9APHY|nr:hypothetical protein BD309DRAFT_52815 [Dichomitus squalens]TBU55799.1 hypothetical protein BD310DRAFT_653037 [Dichomitus squalens]